MEPSEPSTSSLKGKEPLEIVTEVTMGDLSAFDEDPEATPRPKKLALDVDSMTSALPQQRYNGPSTQAGLPPKVIEIAMSLMKLPMRLQRPRKTDISPEALAAVDPALSQVPLDIVLSVVREKGPEYLKTLSSARVELVQLEPGERTARIIDVTLGSVTDAVSAPTHVLAVVEQEAERLRLEGRAKPTIRLIPVYNLVLASQCAKLPPLPPALQQDAESGLRRVRLPVCRLVIPNLQAFPLLLNYLYSHSIPYILRALLPLTQDVLPALMTPRVFNLSSTPAPAPGSSAPAPAPPRPPPPPKFNRFALPSLAGSAAKAGIAELSSRVQTLHGLWSNAEALGVMDGPLWAAMDLSWDILLGAIAHALAVATGNAPRPPSPPPRPIKGSRRMEKFRAASAASQASQPSQPSRSVSGSSFRSVSGSSSMSSSSLSSMSSSSSSSVPSPPTAHEMSSPILLSLSPSAHDTTQPILQTLSTSMLLQPSMHLQSFQREDSPEL